MVQLSESQDQKVGDGTTSVVVFASALCENALPLLEKGINPSFITKGYSIALHECIHSLESFSQKLVFDEENTAKLVKMATIPLNSKFVSRDKDRLAQLCVDSVLRISGESILDMLTTLDISRKDCDLRRIKFEFKEGESLEETQFIEGVILKKSLSHENMKKVKYR
jgi:T-complex protein 1 subunit epsilon